MEEMADAAAYEAQRRRQIEENKRRIEELGLRHLAAAAMLPKAKQLKLKRKALAPGAVAPPRRSGRGANLPDHPDYRENIKKKIVIGPTAAERSYAIAKVKAGELEGKLSADYPTFVKTMSQRSPTAFSLTLPPQFCREHLPDPGTLVDDEDDEFDMPYYNYKEPNDQYHCHINRWRGFAIDHKLDEGDCGVPAYSAEKVQGIHHKSTFLLENDEPRASNILLEQKNEELVAQMEAPQFLPIGIIHCSCSGLIRSVFCLPWVQGFY